MPTDDRANEPTGKPRPPRPEAGEPKGKGRAHEQVALESTEDAASAPRLGETPRSAALPTRDGARYRRGGEIARGGIGRVLSVWDSELDRHIAVKELLAPSPNRLARFEREVRITARLQHPAIIGLLEGGRWPSGEPFFTMKHVEGRPLDKAIAEKPALADRLALLPHVIAAAEALAYAHSKRIIHRDLKPANVLVGSFGETVVIDWGLAKDLANPHVTDDGEEPAAATSDPQLTSLGQAIGTPAYMSPEQARGQFVDERVDVYSLGAMLYHLLAGKCPYHTDRASSASDILDRVLYGPPASLVDIEPRAPADLCAIVRKAMARQRARRYANAGELADELKRFQTGQLVGAHRYSKSELLRRWVRRHRTALAVAAVMLTLLVIGAVTSVWRIAEERDEAKQQRALAEQQRSLAEHDREKVEELLDFMLVDLRDKLDPLGKVALLEEVAGKAQEYYVERPPSLDRPDESRRRVLAHLNLGDVLFDQGHLDKALREYEDGLSLAQQVLERAPASPAWRRELANSHRKVGKALREQGKHAEALQHQRSALEIARELARQDPDGFLSQRCLAKSHYSLGAALRTAGDSEAALAEFQAALEVGTKVTRLRPDDAYAADDLLLDHTRVALLLDAKGDHDTALKHLLSALEIAEKLLARDAENTRWRRRLAMTQINIGDALRAKGDFTAAHERYAAAMVTSEWLAKRDPLNADRQRDLSLAHERLGGTARARGDLGQALGYYREALAIAENLAGRNSTSATAQNDLARAALHVAGVLRQQGSMAEARQLFRRCADAYRKYATSYVDYYNTACCNAAAGELDGAFENLGKAIESGFRDADWLEKDPDLAPLRLDARWRELTRGLSGPTD